MEFMTAQLPDRDLKPQKSTGRLFMFNYRRGSATFTYHCEARDEDYGLRVARAWCKLNSVTLCGDRVIPWCVDESILKIAVEPEPESVGA